MERNSGRRRRTPPFRAGTSYTPFFPALEQALAPLAGSVGGRGPSVWKSQLSAGRRWLVETMQRVRHGRIEQLYVLQGEPLLNPRPRVCREYRLTAFAEARTKTPPDDFLLKDQVVRMFQALDEIAHGLVLALEIRDGLPWSISVEEPFRA